MFYLLFYHRINILEIICLFPKLFFFYYRRFHGATVTFSLWRFMHCFVLFFSLCLRGVRVHRAQKHKKSKAPGFNKDIKQTEKKRTKQWINLQRENETVPPPPQSSIIKKETVSNICRLDDKIANETSNSCMFKWLPCPFFSLCAVYAMCCPFFLLEMEKRGMPFFSFSS